MATTNAAAARIGLLLAVAILAPACDWAPQTCEGEWAAVPADEKLSMTQSRLVAQVNPTDSNAVDMLFVIDDSRSMTDEQQQLGIWSNEMFDVLSPTGELPDLHIAIVSSSVAIAGVSGCEAGTGGTFQVGTATLQKSARFISDVAGPAGRVRNYDGTLTDTFAKMARVGDGGCGYEQPFKAAAVALTGRTPGSEGFLRDNALLLVVFVTDEDDCSSTSSALYADPYADTCSDLGPSTSYRCFEHGVVCHDGKGSRVIGERRHCRADDDSAYEESVTDFANALKRLKPPGQVIVAGIYGKPNHVATVRDERITTSTTPRLASVCGGGGPEGTGATPAVRMNALMAEFGGRASQSSICDDQLSWAMRDVGLVTRDVAIRSHCLRGPLIDVDTSTPGVQPACHIDVARDLGTARETRVNVPSCDRAASGDSCFTLDVDEFQCGETDTQVAFRIHNGEDKGTLEVACDVNTDDAIIGQSSTSDPRAFD